MTASATSRVQVIPLTLTKTADPDTVQAGNSLTYTLKVTNNRLEPTPNVRVTDTLPAGVQFDETTASQGSCMEAAGIVTCALGDLASGATATVTIVVTPTPQPDLRLTKLATPDPVVAGQPLTYTLTVTNQGERIVTNTAEARSGPVTTSDTQDTAVTSPAPNVTVTDMLPRGVTFASDMSDSRCTESSGLVACPLGDLASGAEVIVPIVVTVDPDVGECSKENPITNMAMVSSDDVSDPDDSNNTAIVRTLVEDRPFLGHFLGHFKVFAKGVGLKNDSSSGEIRLDIPGEPIQAFLTWQKAGNGVQTMMFSSDSKTEEIPGKKAMAAGTKESSCFLADVTEFIVQDDKTYTVSALDKDTYFGAGLLVIAEDPSFPLQRIEVKRDFCDYFFWGTPGHEDSEVIMFEFAKTIAETEAKITLFVGDAQSTCYRGKVCRGNEILFLSDAGDISLGKDETGLVANEGKFWDTFGRNSGVPKDPGMTPENDPDLRGEVLIPPGARFASFQLLSLPPAERDGVSAFVSMAAFELLCK